MSGAPSRYTFDETSGIFTVPDTTVGTLKSYIVPSSGTTVKIMNYDETIEREDANPVTDTMKVVAAKFEETKAWNLPVEDENGTFVGFISKSGLLSSYRQILVSFTSD